VAYTQNSKFNSLGVGVGLRGPHHDQFIGANRTPSSVSWVEVITENFMDFERYANQRQQKILERVRERLPVALHGVSLSLGSADALNEKYLDRLSHLVDKIQPAWISDHLCWTGFDGINRHDLLPLPYTEEAIRCVSEKILKVQDRLKQRILIENVSSYLDFHSSQMTEWQFLSEILVRSDCGLLLDLNNVYVNSVNHHFDPYTYLLALPTDRVGQIHLAGHSKKEDFLIDTHDEPVCAEVWELYQWALKHFGDVSVMLERDDQIPEWSVLENELGMIHSFRTEALSGTPQRTATAR
jgi:uncharacterized protein (UPF0276 family)